MIRFAEDLEFERLTSPVPGLLHHAHCSGIVAFLDGELLAVFYWAIKEANRKQAIYACRKKKGGKWSSPVKIIDDRFRMVGNPAIWIAPDTGRLFLFFVRSWGGWALCNPRYTVSVDRGHTWSKSKPIYRFISRGIKNPPIMLSTGRYVLPAYVEFRDYYGVFYLSDDGGKTWRDCGARVGVKKEYIPPGKKWERLVLQPTVIERKDGSLMALMRAVRPLGKMFMTESFDGGETWSEAVPYILPNPGGAFHMIRLKSGRIAIIYNHAPVPPDLGFERNPLSVALSEDDGKTWKYRRNLIEARGEDVHTRIGGYPTITQDKEGVIHATWSYAHTVEHNGRKISVTDIMYTSFTEEWIMRRKFFDEPWESP